MDQLGHWNVLPFGIKHSHAEKKRAFLQNEIVKQNFKVNHRYNKYKSGDTLSKRSSSLCSYCISRSWIEINHVFCRRVRSASTFRALTNCSFPDIPFCYMCNSLLWFNVFSLRQRYIVCLLSSVLQYIAKEEWIQKLNIMVQWGWKDTTRLKNMIKDKKIKLFFLKNGKFLEINNSFLWHNLIMKYRQKR
jgi:hypothetical protein